MSSQLEKEYLSKIEQQEKEVLRLTPLVDQVPTSTPGKQLDKAELQTENQKLTLQLKQLKDNAEAKLKEKSPHLKNISNMLRSFFSIAVEKAFPKTGFCKTLVQISPSSRPQFGDYQFNSAMAMKKALNDPSVSPKAIAEKVVANFPDTLGLVEKLEVAGPGFVNIFLNKAFVVDEIRSIMKNGVKIRPQQPLRVLVDFSSPNVAKEMHVGHLRSTIIGDVISRIIEYQGHHVLRINHVGDWGTQFGMLIAHLQDSYDLTNLPASMAVEVRTLLSKDLQTCYKESKKRFDEDPEFKKRAYQAVVALQSKDKVYIDAWKMICNTSRIEFQKIYERLGVVVQERGESFYQDLMVDVVDFLTKNNYLIEDEGRKIMFPAKIKNIPLTVVKSDGGFTYDTSDMAAIKQRIEEEKADWIIYVTDAGQATHFHVIFDCAEQVGILDRNKVRVDHVGFGVVLGEDRKKFKTRSGDTVRLKELLDEGIKRAREKLIEKGRDKEMSPEELEVAEKALAYGCIKYSDLAHNFNNEYVFSFDKMLDDKGNTAVYLLYAYTRIKSIARKAEVTIDQLNEFVSTAEFDFTHEKELKLCKKLLKFPEVMDTILKDLHIHPLCELMYEIATTFTEFYDACYCIEVDCKSGTKKIHMNRLALCEATAVVLKQCFDLLGISTISKM